MPREIELEEVRELLERGAQLVDVLPEEEYEHEHMPGAINLPLKRLNAKTAAVLDRDRPVITYCYDHECDMSARAAWRLETLGFEEVYDYVASETDWFANGLPREGHSTEIPHAGDLAHDDAPTCELEQQLGEAAKLTAGSSSSFCLVVNRERILLGRLRERVLQDEDPGRPVGEVMEEGPSTIRPNMPIEELLQRAKPSIQSFIVTTSHGELLGVFSRSEAEAALGQPSASALADG